MNLLIALCRAAPLMPHSAGFVTVIRNAPAVC